MATSLLYILMHHYRFCDGIILFHNDDVRVNCSSDAKLSSVSYELMNEYIARCIAGVTFPTDTLASNMYVQCVQQLILCKTWFQIDFCYQYFSALSCGLELSELVRSVCPQPNLKFLAASHVTRQDSDIKSLLSAVTNHMRTGNSCTKVSLTLSMMSVYTVLSVITIREWANLY